MLRTLLLYLSNAGWAQALISNFFVARRVARRFVAGETLDEAIDAVRKLNQDGLLVTLDLLGESVHSADDAKKAADEYLEILDKIEAAQVDATVSLKPTQLGLDISEALCLENLQRIVEHAKAHGNHVTIDMESSDYTDQTLNIFHTLHQEYGVEHVGTVIQAYLYRSEADMQALHEAGAFVRLCKGAYKEPADKAFPEKSDVDANFVKLTQDYITNSAAATGAYLGIATHDAAIINATRGFIRQNDIPNARFEYQMLYGIRTDLQRDLAKDGFQVRVYVPFGTQWYPYFMRRLAERPANLWFFLSNLFRP